MPLRYFLPVYLIAYFGAAFFWRSFMVWKRTGVNPVVFKGTDDAHDFIGGVFKFLFALIVAVVLVYCFWPGVYVYFLAVDWLEHSWVKWSGVVLLLLSLVWTVLAQAQMGESWRIGIDQKHSTDLIQSGVFRLSRNPIFIGMMVTLLGLFLVIPNALTMLSFVLGVVLIQVQVRLEEEFLARSHGDQYAQYRRRVGRWI
jgi:protein-S-isoprenylcysteine O-methyltransferase Ste14